jgi:hypothetical protein
MGTTAPDGGLTLEPVYCLGLCATAPSAMIDGRVVGRLDEQRLDAVLAPPLGARLWLDDASNSSPPPCGEGSGVGVVPVGTPVPHSTCPPPPAPPPRGEGVHAARPSAYGYGGGRRNDEPSRLHSRRCGRTCGRGG